MSGILPGLECRHYRQWLGRHGPSSAKRQTTSDTEDYVQRGPERTKEYTVRDEGGLPDVPKSTQASKYPSHMLKTDLGTAVPSTGPHHSTNVYTQACILTSRLTPDDLRFGLNRCASAGE